MVVGLKKSRGMRHSSSDEMRVISNLAFSTNNYYFNRKLRCNNRSKLC